MDLCDAIKTIQTMANTRRERGQERTRPYPRPMGGNPRDQVCFGCGKPGQSAVVARHSPNHH